MKLKVAGGVVTTTEDHPFWNTTDGQFQRADQIDHGDGLLTANGRIATVTGLDTGSSRTALAYNLTINDLNTYYVLAGTTTVLVHNTGPCSNWITRYESGSELAKKYEQSESTRDPASQWYYQELSNDDLLKSINNAAVGDGIVVGQDPRRPSPIGRTPS